MNTVTKYSLLLLLVLQSCAKILVTDGTTCNFDTKKIAKLIKSKGIGTIKEVAVYPDYENRLNNGCNGLYYINVANSTGIKLSYFKENNISPGTQYIKIPILKFNDILYINTASVNGDCSKECNTTEEELLDFKKNAGSGFKDKQLKEIERCYKYGIVITSRGRFF